MAEKFTRRRGSVTSYPLLIFFGVVNYSRSLVKAKFVFVPRCFDHVLPLSRAREIPVDTRAASPIFGITLISIFLPRAKHQLVLRSARCTTFAQLMAADRSGRDFVSIVYGFVFPFMLAPSYRAPFRTRKYRYRSFLIEMKSDNFERFRLRANRIQRQTVMNATFVITTIGN